MPTDYSEVNGGWPATVPNPTPQEAMSAAKRLYRKAMGKPFAGTVKVTSGNRYTYVRRRVLYVNPEGHHFGGWKDLVHDLSHHCHHRLHPGVRPHGSLHRTLEADLVAYVVKSGWLDGKLKSKAKPKELPKPSDKLAGIEKRIKAWETKRKRAETALKKLRAQEARLKKKSLM